MTPSPHHRSQEREATSPSLNPQYDGRPPSPLDAAIGADHGLPDSDSDDGNDIAGSPMSKNPDDVEKGNNRSELEKADGGGGGVAASAPSPSPSDPNLVTWDGPDDPQNPKNWSFKKKWIITVTVSLFTLMSPVGSSMLAPALPAISAELGMKQGSVLQEMSLSVFVLAYAVGPLFLGPLSEILGRQIILQGSNIFYLIFNIACSQARTPAQLLVFRFFAGLGGSAPLAVGGGTMSDLFIPEQRGLATSLYTLAPLTGPALGPIAGAFIAQNTSWRWVFYSSSIADGLVQIAGFIFLQETYAPKILHDKANRLRKETGNAKLHTQFERPDRTFAKVVAHGIARPMTFLLTEPIVQVLASYMAVLYGLMYLTLTTFPTVWTNEYHMPVGIGGLNYLALGIGFTVGTQLGARLLDRIYIKLKKQNDGVGTPEMRMPLMMGTSFAVPIGMIIYGWTAERHVFWLVPDIGIAIFAFGCIGSFLSIQTYIIDNFTLHAASALAAGASLRSLAGFGFPLFAEAMFSKLGVGWGNSLLALIATIFLPAPWLFYHYGSWIRSKSRFAKHEADKAGAMKAASAPGYGTATPDAARAKT